MACSICNSESRLIPYSTDAALCEKCDLFYVFAVSQNSMAEFMEFLRGKRFIYKSDRLTLYDPEFNSYLHEFANSMLPSSEVQWLRLENFGDSESLDGVCSLLEKLPECSSLSLQNLTITKQSVPYLVKIAAKTRLSVRLIRATFTEEACQSFADSFQTERYSTFLFEACTIPSIVPMLNALSRANLVELPQLVYRAMKDQEFSAYVEVVKNNKHLRDIQGRFLTNIQSENLLEAVRRNSSIKTLSLHSSLLSTASSAIRRLVQTPDSIDKLAFNYCDVTLAILTELCDALKSRQQQNLELHIKGQAYSDSMLPLKSLIEANASIGSLTLCLSPTVEEWMSLCESLKKNTTLKKLSFLARNDNLNGSIIDALKFNTTLQELSLEQYTGNIEPLMAEIAALNRLKSIAVYSSITDSLELQNLCHLLKNNTRLTSVHLSSSCRAEYDDKNIEFIKDMFEDNYSLTNCNMIGDSFRNDEIVSPYIQRNINRWISTKQNFATLLHNVARNSEVISLLPIEIWIDIFKQIQFPHSPDNGFEDLAKQIFRQYRLH